MHDPKPLPPLAGRILVLGDYRQTITVVRSLSRAGYAVTLGTDNPRSSTALSRHVSRVWRYSAADARDPQRFCGLVENRLHAERPEFTFVVGESQLRQLLNSAPRLHALTTWVSPHWEVIRRSFDKRSMLALCDRLGVPTAPWVPYNGAPAWRRQAAEMGYPLVIKHGDSSLRVRGRKALIVQTPAELEDLLSQVHRIPSPGSLLMQKFARGLRHNCHFGAAGGDIVAYFQQSVVRTDELDMTGIGIEGISVAPSPQLRGWCQRITRSLGYNGIGCIQFLVDEATGEASFLELNPRMDSTAVLPYRLGCDFPRLAVSLARRERERKSAVPQFPPAYAAGRRYHWLYGDLLAWHAARKCGRCGALQLAGWALRSAWIALTSRHLTWEASDPLPTLHEYWKQLADALHRRLGLRPVQPAVQ